VDELAERVAGALTLPIEARFDALHVAYAIVYQMDYLLTWNCRHLANAERIRRLADFCRSEDIWLPIICTPEEMCGGDLLGEEDVERSDS
jgi:hypothetical protein